MIGTGFIIRFLQFLLYAGLAVGMAAVLATVVVYGGRVLWTLFDHLFHDQAEWGMRQFGIFRPWRFITVPIVTLLCLLCMGAFLVFLFMSGQGPTEVIP